MRMAPNFLLNVFSANIIMIPVEIVVKAEPIIEGPIWMTAVRVRSSLLTSPGSIEYEWLK